MHAAGRRRRSTVLALLTAAVLGLSMIAPATAPDGIAPTDAQAGVYLVGVCEDAGFRNDSFGGAANGGIHAFASDPCTQVGASNTGGNRAPKGAQGFADLNLDARGIPNAQINRIQWSGFFRHSGGGWSVGLLNWSHNQWATAGCEQAQAASCDVTRTDLGTTFPGGTRRIGWIVWCRWNSCGTYAKAQLTKRSSENP